MKLSHFAKAVRQVFIGKQISTTSLQFRLTLELVILSILGLTHVAMWAGAPPV
jgi:hypothetical protein